MPNTIEEIGFTTIAVAIALVALFVYQRRWPNDDPTDSVVLLWRRWAASGRLKLAREEAAEAAAAAAGEKPKPSRSKTSDRKQAKGKAPNAQPNAQPKAQPKAQKAASTSESKAAAKRPAAKAPAGRGSTKAKPARPARGRIQRTERPASPVSEPESDVSLDEIAAALDAEEAADETDRRRPLRRRRRTRDERPVDERPVDERPVASVSPEPPSEEAVEPSEDVEESVAVTPRKRSWRPGRRDKGAGQQQEPPQETVPAAPDVAQPEPAAAPAEPVAEQPVVAESPAADDRPVLPPEGPRDTARRIVHAEEGDHVPLATREATDRTGEPKILLRQRFRRGLARTRDRLGSEMREAFTGGATPEAFDKLEDALVAADVGVATTSALVEDLRQLIGLSDKTLSKALQDAMVTQLQDADRRLRLVRGKLSVWVVVGVNGTGKTTTIAKLAARARDLGIPVSLAAADTFRAAAVEQLSEWGRRLSIDVIQQGQGADPGAVVFDAMANAKASGKRLLIVDTAGRLHTRKPLMDELQKVFRVIERDDDAVIAETLLVIDATTGQNGIAQAKAFKDAVSVTGLALAKLDGSAKGGITFAVERELGVPVKAVGVGESEKDLIPFEPQTFVEALVGDD